MTRLKIYKEFFIELFDNLHKGYSFDQMLEELAEFSKANEGTLDAIAAKTLLCDFYIAQGEFKQAEKIISSLKFTNNNLVDFFILDTSSLYFGGVNDPNIDSNKANEFHKKAKELSKKIIFQDEWEEGMIKSQELFREVFRAENQGERLNLINRAVDLLEKNHSLGYAKDVSLVNFGVALASIGEYERAINIYKQSYESFSKSDISLLSLFNISITCFIINELEQAKMYLSLSFENINQSTNYWLKEVNYWGESLILEYEEKYDDLEINLIKQLDMAKEHQNKLKISDKELNLFSFYINRFRSTENKFFLEKAKNIKEEITLLTNKSNDVRIKRQSDYANAMLLSLGSLKQKAKAVEIYEDLMKVYPKNASYKLELIDLYWKDLEYDVDGESKQQIDLLLSQLKNDANIRQHLPDNSNVSIQILLAKYDFYINKNKDQALDSLYNIQSKAHSIGNKLIEEKVTKAIKTLENDLDWNSDDYSIKERLEKVKVKAYIEGAQMFLDNS